MNEKLVGRLFSIIHHIAWAKKTIQILLLLLKVKHYTICGTASLIGKIRWLMKVRRFCIGQFWKSWQPWQSCQSSLNKLEVHVVAVLV